MKLESGSWLKSPSRQAALLERAHFSMRGKRLDGKLLVRAFAILTVVWTLLKHIWLNWNTFLMRNICLNWYRTSMYFKFTWWRGFLACSITSWLLLQMRRMFECWSLQTRLLLCMIESNKNLVESFTLHLWSLDSSEIALPNCWRLLGFKKWISNK